MSETSNYEICANCRYLADGNDCVKCEKHICFNCSLQKCDWCVKLADEECISCPLCNPRMKLCDGDVLCKSWIDTFIKGNTYTWCKTHLCVYQPGCEPCVGCDHIVLEQPLNNDAYIKY